MKFRTIKELADFLNITKSTVSRWVSNDDMPHDLIGMTYQFELDDVLKWLKEQGGRKQRMAEAIERRELS